MAIRYVELIKQQYAKIVKNLKFCDNARIIKTNVVYGKISKGSPLSRGFVKIDLAIY